MRHPQLPLSVDELTPEWLSSAFETRFPGVRIEDSRVESVLQGTATKVRVHALFNDAGRRAGLPERFIVKGGFSAHRKLMSAIYQIERRFYNEVAPRLPIQVPRSFYAASDPTSGQSIVILEDLDLRGVTFCRVERPLSPEQVRSHLDVLARLHATWWDSREFAAGGCFDWVEELDPLPEGEKGLYQRGQLEPSTYAKYMGLPRGVAVPRRFHDRDRMAAALEHLRELDRRGPKCLLHADYHLGNLFFDAEGGAGVLDWQSIRSGSWAHDYTYFVVSALDMAERREWEVPLLRYYLGQLDRHGVTAPEFEAAWVSYAQQIVYGLYYWLVNPIEFQAELNNCAVAPRFALAALDHQTLERLT